MNDPKPAGFYFGNWGTWGWIETGIKVVVNTFGIAAFVATSGIANLTLGGNAELAALVVMAALALNPLISLPLRVTQKEIISIVYTVFSLLGHAGLLIALARDPAAARGYGIAFGVVYALGELAKMRFLQVSGYTELGVAPDAMIKGVRVVAAGYALLALLLLI